MSHEAAPTSQLPRPSSLHGVQPTFPQAATSPSTTGVDANAASSDAMVGGTRLLADEPVGPVYTTSVALDESRYAELWETIGITAQRPEVDFASSIVIHFGAVYSGNCPNIRFNGVVVDVEASLVYADITRDETTEPCFDDANPRAFVVAVPRTMLPRTQFDVQLTRTVTCQGCQGSERTVVYLDAGSTDDTLEVLLPPATRPLDNPFPPNIALAGESLEDILTLFEAYGDAIDPASAAAAAATKVDLDAFLHSLTQARAAWELRRQTIDEVVARFAADERAEFVMLADTMQLMRQSEQAWVDRLSDLETSIRQRLESPGGHGGHEAWNAAVQIANESRRQADVHLNDFIGYAELAATEQ